jgi:hypothetical protein
LQTQFDWVFTCGILKKVLHSWHPLAPAWDVLNFQHIICWNQWSRRTRNNANLSRHIFKCSTIPFCFNGTSTCELYFQWKDDFYYSYAGLITGFISCLVVKAHEYLCVLNCVYNCWRYMISFNYINMWPVLIFCHQNTPRRLVQVGYFILLTFVFKLYMVWKGVCLFVL